MTKENEQEAQVSSNQNVRRQKRQRTWSIEVDDTPRRSSRPKKAKQFDDYVTYLTYIQEFIDPTFLEEALQDKNESEWRKAMIKEINSLRENKTWILVDLPQDKRVISTKWVFKRKYNEDGYLERYKARKWQKDGRKDMGVNLMKHTYQ